MNDAIDIATGPLAPNASPGETLTSRAYASVRRDIIEGRLKPGSKLKIEELRDRYDVGASPIRESLSLLSSDGLVDRIEQRGFRVADISHEEFADILKVRCWLEDRALRAFPSFDVAQKYVLYCELGLKSAHLADLMRRSGLNARHISGGLGAVRRLAES